MSALVNPTKDVSQSPRARVLYNSIGYFIICGFFVSSQYSHLWLEFNHDVTVTIIIAVDHKITSFYFRSRSLRAIRSNYDDVRWLLHKEKYKICPGPRNDRVRQKFRTIPFS